MQYCTVYSWGEKKILKIAVLSDIHGNELALDYVIEDMRRLNISKCIILGDIVIKGPMPLEVITKLEKLEILGWVKGNTDMWFEELDEEWTPSSSKDQELYRYFKYAKDNLNPDRISFINGFPLKHVIELDKTKILCVHGSPKSVTQQMGASIPEEEIRQAIIDVNEDIILCGHTHCPFIGEVDGKKIFNVGGVGISFDGDNRASYGILDFSGDGVELINRRINYPVTELLRVAKERNFPNFNAYANTMLNATRTEL